MPLQGPLRLVASGPLKRPKAEADSDFFWSYKCKKMYIANFSKAILKPQSKKDSQTGSASATLRHVKPHLKATPEAPFFNHL